ncbi:MAG: 3'-5' exonuclease [Butyricimonas faecihominis]
MGQFHSEFYAPKISDEKWKYAKLELQKMYGKSSKIEIVNRLLKDFEETNKSGRYKSDLELFIRESKLEDFLEQDGETIFVSTMHIAKGREFDNVFLHLEGFLFFDEERLLRAMTRQNKIYTFIRTGRIGIM